MKILFGLIFLPVVLALVVIGAILIIGGGAILLFADWIGYIALAILAIFIIKKIFFRK